MPINMIYWGGGEIYIKCGTCVVIYWMILVNDMKRLRDMMLCHMWYLENLRVWMVYIAHDNDHYAILCGECGHWWN